MTVQKSPQHVAIIMDGNGRWAQNQGKLRVQGHTRGASRVHQVVEHAVRRGLSYLTLFAFSSENWKRPQEEVSAIMRLFSRTLQSETEALRTNGVRLRVAGDTARFPSVLRDLIAVSEEKTAAGDRLVLTICANYGGRWDIMEAAKRLRSCKEISEEIFGLNLGFNWAPPVDLLIRTGGESRISNFLLWQAAYAELYFTDCLWPDFSDQEFDKALSWYAGRQRRFGMTSEQVCKE